MGCCSPEYRKVVNEKEEEINKNRKDSLPLPLKISIIIITAGAILTYFLIK